MYIPVGHTKKSDETAVNIQGDEQALNLLAAMQICKKRRMFHNYTKSCTPVCSCFVLGILLLSTKTGTSRLGKEKTNKNASRT